MIATNVRRIRIAISGLLFPLCLCLVAAGCGGSKGDVKLIPVSGKVFFGKDPMPLGSVMFFPDADKGNTSKRVGEATIQSDGSYKLATGGDDGVEAGWYKVTVTITGMSDPSQAKMKIPNLKGEYGNTKLTPISIEVGENVPASNYDIRLSR